MTGEEIRALEEAFYLAWPAAEATSLHGWRLRFSGGVSRRANSVFPLDWDGHDLDEDVSVVEEIYANQGLDPAFYLAPISQPGGLDDALAARGYGTEGHVYVQTCPLSRAPAPAEESFDYIVNGEMTGPWTACYRDGSADPGDQAGRAAIMARAAGRRAYILVHEAEQAVGCGMVLSVGDRALIQGMRTLPGQRGRGIGGAVLGALMRWAGAQGARGAALQVETDNPAALALYGKAGFATAYAYHYRTRR